LPDLHRERLQSRLDITDPALASPVTLGREIDDERGRREPARLKHEHPTWLDFVPPARQLVRLEVRRKTLLELERDAPPHYADAVDGVDERIGLFDQDVARLVLDHGFTRGLIVPGPHDLDLRRAVDALQRGDDAGIDRDYYVTDDSRVTIKLDPFRKGNAEEHGSTTFASGKTGSRRDSRWTLRQSSATRTSG
jgi:hypothetical protein